MSSDFFGLGDGCCAYARPVIKVSISNNPANVPNCNFTVEPPMVVPDGEPVGEAIRAAIDGGARAVLTTGGTGVTPTDRTPEDTRALGEALAA